jgi:hypothetical protein
VNVESTVFWVEMLWLGLTSASAGFLLGLLIIPENDGDMALRNVRVCPNYTELQAKRPHSSFLNYEKLNTFGL